MNRAPAPVQAPPAKPKRKAFDKESQKLLSRFLKEWVFPRWQEVLIALLLTVCLAAATGGYPLMIDAAFDELQKNTEGALVFVLGGIIAITCARSLFLYLQAVATQAIVNRVATDLQKTAFSHLISADFARLSRETPGRLVSRLTNDIAYMQQGLQAGMNTAVRDALMVTALVGSMFYLDWVLSIIVLFVFPIAAIPIAAISERLRRVAKQTQSELGDMTSLLTEKLSGARLIKTFQLESYAAKKVHHSFEQVFDLRMKAVRNRSRIDPMLEALGGLAVAGVIAVASWRISSGITTIGDFMGFVTALLMAAQSLRGLGNLSGRVQEALAAAENFYAMLDERPKIVDVPDAKELVIKSSAIRFENVSFAYDRTSNTHAVANFDLDIPGGATVALVGQSGAGKSTIINLVPRLFDVTEGRITIDGQNIRDVQLASLRSNIAIVSQDVTLFDDTIAANIALGRLNARQDDIIEAAKAAAAHDFILAQPEGYTTMIGDRGMRLSGGQRQRLALARAILTDAPILLLDEATSALDTESERLVQDALAQFTKNRTTLVIAHRLSTVRDADMICVMDKARIIEVGTHDALMARGQAYARLADSQLIADRDAAQ